MGALLGVAGVLLLIGFFVLLLRSADAEKTAEHDDGIIRALRDWPEVLKGQSPQGYCPAPAPERPPVNGHESHDLFNAIGPFVFRPNRRKPWQFGGNAHQRRMLRRANERAGA